MVRGRWPESTVNLPGGILLSEDELGSSPCAAVVLRPLTGDEEEWLARNRDIPNAQVASLLLDACILRVNDGEPPPGLVQRMLVGDRDYLILQLRRLMLGDRVQAIVDCPACGSPMDVEFDAARVPVGTPPSVAVWHSLELEGRAVRFRLPTGVDQEFIARADLASAVEILFNRCVAHDGGEPLACAEKAAVIEAIGSAALQVDLELDLKCPECGHAFLTPFDITAFFFDEMRINNVQLFREIHSLAYYYHWSESEIMGMVRERRRMYLSLLNDALREE